jgi:hypothetical protein
LELSEEESGVPEPQETTAEWPIWSGYLRAAWHCLREDRFYGSMGGVGRIYYTAISRYAEDNGIEIEPFNTFIQAIDGEYVVWAAKKAEPPTPPQD